MAEYKDFPKAVWDKIYETVEQACKDSPNRLIAAFDADGTLWNNDAGNAFFNYEIDNKLIPLPEKPWDYVYSLKAQSAISAFLWLAQVHKGVPVQTVKEWALDSFRKQNFEYFPAIKKLISFLKSKNFEIYVVTASVKWAVEPCVKDLGIDADHVLGFQTEVHNGIITDIQAGAPTYRAGKAEALLEKTGGIKPTIACGNTMGDFWMLDISTLPLTVRSLSDDIQFQDSTINQQEEALYQEALKKGWITHNFV